jgi:hypothetical protein
MVIVAENDHDLDNDTLDWIAATECKDIQQKKIWMMCHPNRHTLSLSLSLSPLWLAKKHPQAQRTQIDECNMNEQWIPENLCPKTVLLQNSRF